MKHKNFHNLKFPQLLLDLNENADKIYVYSQGYRSYIEIHCVVRKTKNKKY